MSQNLRAAYLQSSYSVTSSSIIWQNSPSRLTFGTLHYYSFTFRCSLLFTNTQFTLQDITLHASFLFFLVAERIFCHEMEWFSGKLEKRFEQKIACFHLFFAKNTHLSYYLAKYCPWCVACAVCAPRLPPVPRSWWSHRGALPTQHQQRSHARLCRVCVITKREVQTGPTL